MTITAKRWLAALAFSFLVPGCGADEEKSAPPGSSLEGAAPLHVDLLVDRRERSGVIRGEIHTSLAPSQGGCELRKEKLRVSTSQDMQQQVVRPGEANGESCEATSFTVRVQGRGNQWPTSMEPTEVLDIVEIWDDPDWKVRIKGVDIFQQRAWRLSLDVQPRTRLGGNWSHEQDDLHGRIRSIWYDVKRDHDDPERGSYRIVAEDIQVDGSYFEFTMPGIPIESQGVFMVEVEEIPLDVECENSTCAARLNEIVETAETFLMLPR